MIGNIYINGQIGSDDDLKGVELQDVVVQMEKMKNYEKVNVFINSVGGYVSVGNSIADYLSGFENVYTIADNFCASIATIIHLAVPLARRKVTAGTKYFIHNPLLQNISGNSEELENMANGLKDPQKKMTSVYITQTGMTKEAVEALMKQETSLTDEQMVALNFASEIIKKEEKAVALFDNLKINKTSKKMSDYKTKVGTAIANACKVLGLDLVQVLKNSDREMVALTFEVEQGLLETPFSDLLVGDPVTLNGETAKEGDYVLPDGSVISVDVDGYISNIVMPEPDNMEEEMAMLKTQNEELTSRIAELETANTEALAFIDGLKQIRSNAKPIVALNNPKIEKIVKSPKQLADERKASRK